MLGFWIKNSQSASNWVDVFSELKTRGLQDVLIISCDNLSGISQAIEAVFPQTDVQKCIVHQIRNSLLKVSYKGKKEFAYDMKRIIKRLTKNLQCKILMNLRKNEGKISLNCQILICKFRWINDIFLNIHMNWDKQFIRQIQLNQWIN
ncbi:hypothetical protein CSW10_02430 [Mesomycoplasma dispar]|uniref:Mutator family transposase n=1 Tax=Mesomycoplasma dispar TaxID=86660 RepID=A0ABN5DUD7_9BACT|nr:hypothetical protein CSW10_02430 [Mesomycoplasma dispar]